MSAGTSRTIDVGRPGRPVRIGVMLSGSGRTLDNLLTRIDAGTLAPEREPGIGLVIASRECRGVEIATRAGIETRVIGGTIPGARLEELLVEHAIDLVVLAGYLRMIEIPRAYDDLVVNIHPALLPSFGGPGMHGMNVHRAVLERGCRVSGCTVHLCDAEYDRGPILLQKACPVLEGDDADTLAARVFELEKDALPEALELMLDGRVQVEEGGDQGVGPRARILGRA